MCLLGIEVVGRGHCVGQSRSVSGLGWDDIIFPVPELAGSYCMSEDIKSDYQVVDGQ